MTLINVVTAYLWCALIAYAILGGADFGGGVWDALAHGPSASKQRGLIAHAMGPVWEANHVWLIALIVGLFTNFPGAFAALSQALYLPLSIALVGIVLRGAAFAFRANGVSAVGPRTPWGTIFGTASIVTPAAFGAAAAIVAAGGIRVRGATVLVSAPPWLIPFALDCSALSVTLAAQLAAMYLAVEAEQRDDRDLRTFFARRAIWTGGIAAFLGALGLALAHRAAPLLVTGLEHRALPLVVAAALCSGVGAVAAVAGWIHLARLLVVAQVAAVLGAWGLGQYPYIVVPDLTIQGSAASEVTMTGFLLISGVGALFLLPALWLLFHTFKGMEQPSAERAGTGLRDAPHVVR